MCVVYQYDPPADGGHYRALMFFDGRYYAAVVVPAAAPEPGERRYFGEQVEPSGNGRVRVLTSCGHRHRRPEAARKCMGRLPLLAPPARCPRCGEPVSFEELITGVLARNGDLVFGEVRDREFTCPNRHTVPVVVDQQGRILVEESES